MLETIPIYRMALQPASYLLEANPGIKPIDLICALPNAKNQYRRKAMTFLPPEKHEEFYIAHLLVETRIFIREMLSNCCIKEDFEAILRRQDFLAHVPIIEQFQPVFFRYLVLHDLRRYKLIKGHMETEVNGANSVAEMLKQIKKYGVVPKLFQNLKSECQQIKNIYCT